MRWLCSQPRSMDRLRRSAPAPYHHHRPRAASPTPSPRSRIDRARRWGSYVRQVLPASPGQQAAGAAPAPDAPRAHRSRGSGSGEEVRAVAHRVDLVAVDVLEGRPDRHPARVPEPELGEQRRGRQPGGEQGDVVGHLGAVGTHQPSLADVAHDAPGAHHDTAPREQPPDPSACAGGQVRTDERTGLDHLDRDDVSARTARWAASSSPEAPPPTTVTVAPGRPCARSRASRSASPLNGFTRSTVGCTSMPSGATTLPMLSESTS